MEQVSLPASKRVFDIVMSIVLLIALSPFIVLIFIAMCVESLLVPSSRGGFLYSETRISQGKPFKFYKIRIFKEEIVEYEKKNGNGHVHTKPLEKDPRNLTYVGRVLRKIYFDELGQFINVLRGEMSLVGPRPTNIENYKKLIARGCYSKALLPAGITGYFQSHKGLVLSMNQEEADMAYVRLVAKAPSWKILLYDTRVLLVSVLTVLRSEGI